MIRINQIKLNINANFDTIYQKISKILKISTDAINKDNIKILKKSIDLRDKNNICYVYNIAVDVDNEENILFTNKDNNVSKYIDNNIIDFNKHYNINIKEMNRPIIIGFGPAGMFCAYVLALNGLKPIILERGKEYNERFENVNQFLENGRLDENSNISFGEGGAGTFSDGKLNTNNNDKDGLMQFVLYTFVKFGADKKILYENNSHIGTDLLKTIIQNLRKEIISLGSEVRFNYKWSYNDDINQFYHSPKILCIGNSARDTFYDLYKNGFDIKSKSIAMGFRVAHKQDIINEYQYNNKNIAITLGNATYKLVHKHNNKSIYSFCTCPGGYIINSSNFDYYTSVPTHKSKIKKRGYDQTRLIAVNAADLYKCKYKKLLIQYKSNKSQKGLSAKERRKNVKDIYKISEKYNVQGKTILIIDDVVTTGSTLSACADILLQNGAKAVYCATITYTKVRIRR